MSNFISIFRLGCVPGFSANHSTIEGVRYSFVSGAVTIKRQTNVVRRSTDFVSITVESEVLTFPYGSYLKISEAAGHEIGALMYSKSRIKRGRVLAALEVVRPKLIEELVYEGLEDTEGWMAVAPEAPMVVRTAYAISGEDLIADLSKAAEQSVHADLKMPERLALVGRWFRRARESSDPVDRFLFLYFAIEVFPSRDAEVPNAVADFVVDRTQSFDRAKVKAILGLGRITGLRGRIVHNGHSMNSFDEFVELQKFTEILEELVLAAVECLVGACCRERLRNLLVRHLQGEAESGSISGSAP